MNRHDTARSGCQAWSGLVPSLLRRQTKARGLPRALVRRGETTPAREDSMHGSAKTVAAGQRARFLLHDDRRGLRQALSALAGVLVSIGVGGGCATVNRDGPALCGGWAPEGVVARQGRERVLVGVRDGFGRSPCYERASPVQRGWGVEKGQTIIQRQWEAPLLTMP